MNQKTLFVVAVTPMGKGGKGGIDRIMDEVREIIFSSHYSDVDCSFVASRGNMGRLLSPLFLIKSILFIFTRKLLRRVDLVHINLSSHGSTDRKIILARCCRILSIPYIIHLHGSRMKNYWFSSSPKKRDTIAHMFSSAARIIVLGESWKIFVADQVPDAVGNIVILPNASPKAEFMPTFSTVVRILFLGRLGQRKGVPDLIEALSLLPRDGQWFATIAGDGDVQGTVDHISALGLENKVAVTGWIGTLDVKKILANSDVLVLPSYDENLPMSVIEGMAAGLAVVATPVGSTEEIIIDGDTGLLVSPGDIKGLRDALASLIIDEPLRMRLGRSARIFHSDRLEITSYVDRLVKIWLDVSDFKRAAA